MPSSARDRQIRILIFAWLGLSLLRLVLAQFVPFPFVFDDELEYWLFGHQILHGHFAFVYRGVLWHYPDYMFPAIIAGIAHLSRSLHTQYVLVRTFDSIAVSAVLFPTYAFARDLGAKPRSALIAGVLAGFVSGAAYSASILTESVYYPLFVLLAWLIWRFYGRPRPLLGMGVGVLLGILCLMKPQTYMVYPILLLLVLLGHPRTRERIFLASSLLLLLASFAVLSTRFLVAAHEGYRHLFTLHAFLGFYHQQGASGALPPPLLWAAFLAAYVVVFLMIAAATPLWVAFAYRRRPFGESRFWILTLSFTIILILYFSRNTVLFNILNLNTAMRFAYPRAMERYLFPVLPLWFIAFVLGLEAHEQDPDAVGRKPLGIAMLVLLGIAGAALPSFFGQLLTFDSPGLSIFWTLAKVTPVLFALGLLVFGAIAYQGLIKRSPVLLAALMLLMTLGWYPSVYGTNSPWNAATASALVPFINRYVPKSAMLVLDTSVDSGIAHNILFFSPHTWVWVSDNRAPAGHSCDWLLTASPGVSSLGPSLDGYTLVRPTCSR